MKNLRMCFLISTLFLISYFSSAQQYKIDSLNNVLKNAVEDTAKVNTLNMLSRQYASIGGYELSLQYAQQALKQGENLLYKKGIGTAYLNIGTVYWNKSNYEMALEAFTTALKVWLENGNKQGIANSYNNIGLVYWSLGNYELAVENLLKSLKIWEGIGNKPGIGMAYLNIGNIYLNQSNYEKALEFYSKSLIINIEVGNKNFVATNLNNIGIIYGNQGNFEKALENHFNALKIREEIKDKNGIAMSYNNIGLIYYEQGHYSKALDNQLKCQIINKEIGNIQGVGVSYTNISNIYIKQKKYEDALHYNDLALSIGKSIGYKQGIKDTYLSFTELYDKKGDFKQALKYHKLFSEIKDTLLNEQSSKQVTEMNTKYDTERKDKELIKKDSEISKQQAETEKKNLQRNAFIIGFVLVLVLAFFIYRGYRQKRAANGLLEEKNILIENQKELVEEKNLKITESINYAKRIQQAILPSHELIRSFLPESFIFFKPKDIVSGDFYWFSEKNDKLLIAVADCTGHGVPGAFMSMIGNTLLNEIVNVKNICEPPEILNQLNKGIVALLHQSDNTADTQDDGMDITVLAIDKINSSIEFAGANHFSYLFNKTEYQTLTGDVFSIGGMFGGREINFTSQKIKIEKDNTLYLFTDGFIDQFGGEKNTKFLSNRFGELLQSIQQYGIEQHQEKITTAFENWKGNNKQLDDILIVGIRI